METKSTEDEPARVTGRVKRVEMHRSPSGGVSLWIMTDYGSHKILHLPEGEERVSRDVYQDRLQSEHSYN